MTRILNQISQRGILCPSVRKHKEVFPIRIPAGEVFHSCRLTILDSLLGGDARIAAQPAPGATGNREVAVEWLGTATAMVQYQVEAFSGPAPGSPAAGGASVTQQMTDFSPSANGFPFDNRFEAVPPLPLIGELRYGDASKGMCGGMAYAALDYFNAGLNIPLIPTVDMSPRCASPMHGPIFDYIGRRLFDSFDLPTGVWNYIELMQPNFPAAQARRGSLGLAPRSRAWRMVRQEWPKIKRRLDVGEPCPLGLVCVETDDIRRLGEHHQVLAYGYDQVGDDLTIYVYDPNKHGINDVTLKLNIADPEHKIEVAFTGYEEVLCFFQTAYRYSLPPSEQAAPGRIILFEGESFCGKSIDMVRAQPDLSLFKEGNFDDRTSSLTILGGNWSFYREPNFGAPIMRRGARLVVGPGAYSKISDLGIPDDEISSLQEVADAPNC